MPRLDRRTREPAASSSMTFVRYLPDVPLIEDLNLVADEGHTIAIVGPTGAGKTTLVNLLMRFYEIDGGRITVDGVDVKEMTRDDLRRTFGMVLQDAWLFQGTIRENIAYGRLDATEEEIIGPPRLPTSTTSCGRCPGATTRSSTTTRRASPPVRSSSSRSRAHSSPTRGS